MNYQDIADAKKLLKKKGYVKFTLHVNEDEYKDIVVGHPSTIPLFVTKDGEHYVQVGDDRLYLSVSDCISHWYVEGKDNIWRRILNVRRKRK